MTSKTPFASIERQELTNVAGGAARVATTSKNSDLDSKLQQMLSQIGDSIKDVAKGNSGTDQMMPMMMMMMMMGGGGGGGSAPAPAPAPAPTYVRVNVRR